MRLDLGTRLYEALVSMRSAPGVFPDQAGPCLKQGTSALYWKKQRRLGVLCPRDAGGTGKA